MIRFFLLYLIYLFYKIKNYHKVKFNGFTVVYSFQGSKINFSGGKILINSSPLSNLLGLYQRTIIVARHSGKITIGNNCGISGSTLYAMEEITIGNNVIIGANCKIIDNDFHPLDYRKRDPQLVENIGKKKITIGDGCFIGANSIILKGTELGCNCVVGAGSVVSGKFPDNVIIAGNPAKEIRQNVL
jgi:acetyltransferase-like isoleucine patch superfamily enzyme